MAKPMLLTVETGMLFDIPRAKALLAAERLVGVIGESGVLVTFTERDRQCSLVVTPDTTIGAIRHAVDALQPPGYDFLLKLDNGCLLEDRTTVATARSLASAPGVLQLWPHWIAPPRPPEGPTNDR